MEDTWTKRDRPVLEKAVQLVDQTPGEEVRLHDIADALKMDIIDVGRAAVALSGEFLTLRKGGLPDTWVVTAVTPHARRLAGQWPGSNP